MWTKFFTHLSWRIAGVLLSVSFVLLAVNAYLIYETAYDKELNSAQQTMQEFVSAVSQTAAVAAYLNDNILAKEVVEGLYSSELIGAVEISSTENYIYSAGDISTTIESDVYTYTLNSPFDENELVGKLIVRPDKQAIQAAAKQTAKKYVVLIVVTSLFFILIVVFMVNSLLIKPINNISRSLHHIIPGTQQRVLLPDYKQQDEMTVLADDINHLLTSVERQFNKERSLRTEIQLLERRFRKIFEQTSGGIALINENGLVQMQNPAFESLVGMEVTDTLAYDSNSSIYALLDFNPENEREIRQKLRAQQSVSLDFKLERYEGDIWLNCILSPLPSDEGQENLYELVLTDISTQRQREDLFKQQAEIDTLTGIYNRRAAEKRIVNLLGAESKPSEKYALFMLDLDGFKPINDTYGHDAGDIVLVELAHRFKQTVRLDDIVARWGGDEFVIFIKLSGADYINELAIIAKKLLKVTHNPIQIENHRLVNLGASIGVSIYPDNADNLNELLIKADKAMYDIKMASKDGFKIVDSTKENVVYLSSKT